MSSSRVDFVASKVLESPSVASRQSGKKSSADSSFSLTEDSSREWLGEESLGSKHTLGSNHVIHEPSEILYDEYEEEEEERITKPAPKPAHEPRRVLSLVERWQQLQKTMASAAAAAAKERKERKVTPRKAAKAGAEDGESETIRDQMIKDMQEEVRLEEFNEKRRGELEAQEVESREKQLEITRGILSRHWDAYLENVRDREEEENWSRYMTCNGLPDPGSLADMNTFILVWKMENDEATMDTVAEKCQTITNLLLKLQRIVRFSTTIAKKYVAEYESIAKELRNNLQRWIDLACYRLLRNIEENMVREDMKTTRYVLASNDAVCCIWAPIPLPIGTERPSDKERPIEVEFEEMRLTIKMPADVNCYRMAIRGLWLSYDHYSVETGSYEMPTLSESLLYFWDPSVDLLDFLRQEFQERRKIWEEQAEGRRLRLEEKKGILERIVNPPVASSRLERRGKRGKKRPQSGGKAKQAEFDSLLASIVPPEPQLLPYLPTATEILRQREEENWKETRRLLFTRCEQNEVNLRKYRILGGVIHVDLVYQPPQPKDLGHDTWLTTLELPKEPKFVPFRRAYNPPKPAPDSERTPEVIEAEMKALEAAMEKLPLITFTLPDSIFWFEPPLVAHWSPDTNIWSTRDVHDVKYNEEKQTIAFRSGRLGVHGLAVYKFSNLPFQSWELKPESGKNGREHGGVILNITAATVQAEFIVRGDLVCLNSLVGGSSTPLKKILGEFTDLETLAERMQQVGCDLFPDRDAVSYLKGLATKHPIAEKHLRECMALLSTAYVFAWSRWNATRNFREIVLQFKEVHGCVAKERTNLMLLVTPSRTMRIRCTEVSPEFSDLPLDEEEDSKYYVDLYHVATNTAGIKTRLLVNQISFELASTVARLLERTAVIGMSS